MKLYALPFSHAVMACAQGRICQVCNRYNTCFASWWVGRIETQRISAIVRKCELKTVVLAYDEREYSQNR